MRFYKNQIRPADDKAIHLSIMKFIIDNDEYPLASYKLIGKACEVCPNRLKRITNTCAPDSVKLFSNGHFYCYREYARSVILNGMEFCVAIRKT